MNTPYKECNSILQLKMEHTRLAPGIRSAPLEHKISEIKGYALIPTNWNLIAS